MIKIKMTNDIRLIKLYANEMSKDSRLFEQHGKLINDYFEKKSSFFKNRFGVGEDFKTNARKYLREIKLIK